MSVHLSQAGLAEEWVLAHRSMPEQARDRAADTMERRSAHLAARCGWDVLPEPANLEEVRVLTGQQGAPQSSLGSSSGMPGMVALCHRSSPRADRSQALTGPIRNDLSYESGWRLTRRSQRLRATQISSAGHLLAQSGVT